VALSALGLTTWLPTPLLPVPVALGVAIPVFVYARSGAFRDYIHALDLRVLTVYNFWRVPAALAFFYYGARGDLPLTFVCNAAVGDLIAGAVAPLVVFWVTRHTRGRMAIFAAFHIFSVADFVVAVGTGVTFALLNDPLIGTLKEWPMALIPLFGVPVTGAFSLMTLHRLLTRHG